MGRPQLGERATVVATVEPPEFPAVVGCLGQMISRPGWALERRAVSKGDGAIGSDGGPVRHAASFGNDRGAYLEEVRVDEVTQADSVEHAPLDFVKPLRRCSAAEAEAVWVPDLFTDLPVEVLSFFEVGLGEGVRMSMANLLSSLVAIGCLRWWPP